MVPRILIVLGSTRQNRQGETIDRWIRKRASGRTDVFLVPTPAGAGVGVTPFSGTQSAE